MINLATTGDYAFLFAVAALAGLVGGLAAELLLNRDGETGTFELPGRKGAFFDLGGFAPLLVGAVVGVAILIVFPPETMIVTNAGGETTTSRAYDTVRLVATSLVAGSAGGSVLTALQARVTAAVNETRVQFTAAASEQQLEQLRETATAEASERIRAVVAALAAPTPAAGARGRGAFGDVAPVGDAAPPAAGRSAEAVTEVADEAIAAFAATMERQTDRAKATVDAASATPRRR